MMGAARDREALWPSVTAYVLTLGFALVLYSAPSSVGGLPDLTPSWPLIVLFIWSVRRPWFVSPPVILLVGLLQDLISGGVLGVWALAYLAAFALARPRSEEGSADFGPLVVRFAILCAIAYALSWGAGSAAIGAWAGVAPLITEAIMTILVFPVLGWLFARRKDRSAMFNSGRGG
ncbi:rod shape-determining protein MreD [Alkalicaulis satelles]|uniref:Rod shape-determining protein MreD n=1 Tax=Alkalicaulis satelles TaxID=2609175 RepID=A0A5M6ZJW7_9PROT|nr:rod shape-determining protein MreD [Alkalicaulis satelles]KAA5804630.1 rod shape-determining protein MreD [Alkalicaulis satelles]